ncbi:hypothetical protein FD51_GL002729 [Lacticaseibacillus zeae DSM 20178 = KCTC 3804]|uniref:Uncharacterized protein n=1 Tax=Lacticaseibacillus zeae DSM 20178 = KCTC 3804 TaxID=1423816 RepID=A0A0R1F0T3_LACZE|nr:hypothetical protein FD51_GL002729 [Lacticaseibacillus zeae DSM 20178 = KCTC 3804]
MDVKGQDFNSRSHVDCDATYDAGETLNYDDFNSRSHVDCDRKILHKKPKDHNILRLVLNYTHQKV